jgi:hypothetical protein
LQSHIISPISPALNIPTMQLHHYGLLALAAAPPLAMGATNNDYTKDQLKEWRDDVERKR